MATASVKLPVKRKLWSFTLREILLLMAMISLGLTCLRMQWYAFRPSPFAMSFDAQKICRDVLVAQNLRDYGGSGGSSRGGGVVSARYGIWFPDEDRSIDRAMVEAKQVISEQMRTKGCSQTGFAQSGNCMEIGYSHVGAVGFVQIIGFTDQSQEQSTLLITLHEVSRAGR